MTDINRSQDQIIVGPFAGGGATLVIDSINDSSKHIKFVGNTGWWYGADEIKSMIKALQMVIGEEDTKSSDAQVDESGVVVDDIKFEFDGS